MAERISARLAAAEGRKFGRTVGIAFLLLAAVVFWREKTLPSQILGSVGVFLLVGSALFPRRLKPIERAWMAMAHQISRVTTPIVMGIVFFLVVTPIGVIIRLTKGNPMEHDATDGSYWYDRTVPGSSSSQSMERQF